MKFLIKSVLSLTAMGIVLAAAPKKEKTTTKKSTDSSTHSHSAKVGTKKASSFPSTVKNPVVGEIIVKCAGIVKKGQNHCGANGHDCTALSAKDPKIKDFDPNEWIYVRKEVCEATPGKIIGQKKVIKG